MEGESNPIDAFVRARLHEEGLEPSEPADRRMLIRRAYFDVIGLPPTSDAVESFVKDPAANAFEKVVDQLLDSQHYGERWARHWLDIARYADTRDWRAQTDPRYPFAYTYRDYVIRSLNDDKPYDQFLREQIAADFYTDQPDAPELAALGFLTVGPRFRDNQLEQVADRIDVVTRGLMALTVTCARCHDHKYDAIPIEDYYSLYGVFASTEIPDQYPRIQGGELEPRQVADFQRQHAEKVAALDEYGVQLRREALADLRRNLPKYFAAYYEMSVTKTSQIRGVLSKHKVKETAMTPLAARLDRLLRRPATVRDPVFGPLAQGLGLSEPQFKQQAGTLLADWKQPPRRINRKLLSELETRPPGSRKELLDRYLAVCQEVLEPRSEADRQKSDDREVADPADEELRSALLGDEGLFRFTVDEVVQASRLLGAGRRKLGEFEEAIREVEANHPGSPPRAMALVDKPQPVQPFVMLRGEPQRRGDRVPRRFLALLSGSDRADFQQGSGRKELAEAITDPANPLTARVIVNRVWMHYFGAGLVLTPGDFGLRSDPPSHGELLDWLAATFVEEGWSLKRLQRRILLSETYRQTSLVTSETARQRDPENRLLWRANRKRLDFEAMRDAMLAASGQIDLTVGGRSVSLSEPPFTTRRTLYGYIDRVDMDPLFKTFDFPSPDASAPERPQTTVPQQALFAMNHPFVIEQARELVKRVGEVPDQEGRIERMYQRLFGRSPSRGERDVAVEFLGATPIAAGPNAAGPNAAGLGGPVWQYGYGASERMDESRPEFVELPYWSGDEYRVGEQFPDPRLGHLRLTSTGGHPGRHPVAVIRRWISPLTGTVRIQGKLTHRRDKGDGVRGRILVGSKSLGAWQVFNDTADTNIMELQVQEGQAVDFVVDCVKTPAADAFVWAPVIRHIEDGRPAALWSARSDFAGPPPPPLSNWEQLAQALMLTNEFLYVD